LGLKTEFGEVQSHHERAKGVLGRAMFVDFLLEKL